MIIIATVVLVIVGKVNVVLIKKAESTSTDSKHLASNTVLTVLKTDSRASKVHKKSGPIAMTDLLANHGGRPNVYLRSTTSCPENEITHYESGYPSVPAVGNADRISDPVVAHNSEKLKPIGTNRSHVM